MTEGKTMYESTLTGTWSHRWKMKSLQGLEKGGGGYVLHRDRVPVWD